MRHFHIEPFERFQIGTEAVVLAGNFDLAGIQMLNRVIGAAVTEFELVGFAAQGQ